MLIEHTLSELGALLEAAAFAGASVFGVAFFANTSTLTQFERFLIALWAGWAVFLMTGVCALSIFKRTKLISHLTRRIDVQLMKEGSEGNRGKASRSKLPDVA